MAQRINPGDAGHDSLLKQFRAAGSGAKPPRNVTVNGQIWKWVQDSGGIAFISTGETSGFAKYEQDTFSSQPAVTDVEPPKPKAKVTRKSRNAKTRKTD